MLSEEKLYSSLIDNVMSGGTSFFLGYEAYDARTGYKGQVEQQPQQLLDAILGNAISRVKNILSRGAADPNTCLGIGPVNTTSNDSEHPLGETTSNNAVTNTMNAFKAFSQAQQTSSTQKKIAKMKSVDKVFTWTRVFGNCPTLVHIAVLNIYHRHKRSRELERALGILELLLEHGGAVDYRSMNLFLKSVGLASNPLDFAIGLQKKALYQKKKNLAYAMTQAVGILRKPWKGGGGTTYNSMNIETNNIPFELVTFGCIDSAKNYLYQATDHPDIQFTLSCDDDDADTSVSSNEA
mmetsp:Transcript_593/g.1008  ORF Transcript_593/g.1008 Transcript_593/m.1008 type:complete len:295 (-) Transcript_593:2819-3703(-)